MAQWTRCAGYSPSHLGPIPHDTQSVIMTDAHILPVTWDPYQMHIITATFLPMPKQQRQSATERMCDCEHL